MEVLFRIGAKILKETLTSHGVNKTDKMAILEYNSVSVFTKSQDIKEDYWSHAHVNNEF